MVSRNTAVKNTRDLLISSIGVSNFVPLLPLHLKIKLLSYNQVFQPLHKRSLARGVIHEGYEYVGYFKESKSTINTSSKRANP